jgi:hypothetical protein
MKVISDKVPHDDKVVLRAETEMSRCQVLQVPDLKICSDTPQLSMDAIVDLSSIRAPLVPQLGSFCLLLNPSPSTQFPGKNGCSCHIWRAGSSRRI